MTIQRARLKWGVQTVYSGFGPKSVCQWILPGCEVAVEAAVAADKCPDLLPQLLEDSAYEVAGQNAKGLEKASRFTRRIDLETTLTH